MFIIHTSVNQNHGCAHIRCHGLKFICGHPLGRTMRFPGIRFMAHARGLNQNLFHIYRMYNKGLLYDIGF